jgi:hypothetical protein
MDRHTKQRFAFCGRSLLWSLLLYTVLMLVINWDDVKNSVRGKNPTTIVNVSPTGERQITAPHAAGNGIAANIAALLQAIAGFAK